MLLFVLLLTSSFFINSMDNCPSDIKFEIAKFLIKDGNMSYAIKNIKALSITNRSNNQLLNNMWSIEFIAGLLSQKFGVNKPHVVKSLKMPGSKIWYTSFLKTIPSDINYKFVAAIKDNDINSAYAFLNQGAQIDTDVEANPSLIYTTMKQNIDAARFLLKNGANINIQNAQGETAYICAINLNNIKIVQLLLQYKADKTIKTNDGKTALDCAMFSYP